MFLLMWSRMVGDGLGASSVLLLCPKRFGLTNDRGGWQHAEIATVEGVFDLPVHQENSAGLNGATALPNGKCAATSVAQECLAQRMSIDSDRAVDTADDFPR